MTRPLWPSPVPPSHDSPPLPFPLRCAYKLQDSRRLAVCRDRLSKAREAMHRAYGPNLERARKLHGAFQPELAT